MNKLRKYFRKLIYIINNWRFYKMSRKWTDEDWEEYAHSNDYDVWSDYWDDFDWN